MGLADLHEQRMRTRARRRLTDPLIYKHRNWYNAVLQEELYEAPTGYKLQVFHWSIESGVRQAFQMLQQQQQRLPSQSRNGDDGERSADHQRLDAVSMIIGPNMEYWFGVNTHATHSGDSTMCSRVPRLMPIDPNEQYRHMLPRCPVVLAACNGCSWYFKRGGDASRTDHTVGGNGGENCFFDSIVGIDVNRMSSNNDTINAVVDVASSGEDEDDVHDDGGSEDVLFFRISMSKFRRTTATTYNAVRGRKIRMNVRNAKTRLSTIAELECSALLI